MKIAIVGKGNVGTALQTGLARNGHEVRPVGREPDEILAAGEFADIVILAVPFAEVDNVAGHLGRSVAGKTVVDATNALTPNLELAVGFSTSGAEELQKKLPDAKVVKAFNTVFAGMMATGRVNGEQLAGFAAADDAQAKKQVLDLLQQLGFDPIDVGPLATARLLEPLALLNIRLGFMQGFGTNIGFRFAH